MSDPSKKVISKQGSLSYIEQSLNMISLPRQAPVIIYPGPMAGLQNLSKADLEIANRLAKLRRSSTDLPSEEEMATRLAQLKGLPSDHYTKPSVNLHQPLDNRSQFEKSEDLLKQVISEVKLEQNLPKYDDEIETRLANLRGTCKDNSKQHFESGDTNFELKASSLHKDLTEDNFQMIRNSVKNADQEAKLSLASLADDPEISAAISQACKDIKDKKKKKYKKKNKRDRDISTSDEEKFSGSDTECTVKSNAGEKKKEESEEVERIIKLYTEKARLKKEKKRNKKLLKGTKPSSSSTSESDFSSSESDIQTSESEKLSVSESD